MVNYKNIDKLYLLCKLNDLNGINFLKYFDRVVIFLLEILEIFLILCIIIEIISSILFFLFQNFQLIIHNLLRVLNSDSKDRKEKFLLLVTFKSILLFLISKLLKFIIIIIYSN